MKREDAANSIALRKRFCKDENLPISVLDSPYFEDRLNILNRIPGYNDVLDRWNLFLNEVTGPNPIRGFDGVEEYFAYYNTVKDSAINFIKENHAYQEFNNDQAISKMQINNRFGKRNLYVEQNDGLPFFSIDMKKANFSAMRYYDPQIFDGAESWEEFLCGFTDMQHIVNSKYIRQVILGALNPGRQIKYETSLILNLAEHLDACMKETGANLEIYAIAADEILIKEKAENPSEALINEHASLLKDWLAKAPNGLGKLVRVAPFVLFRLDDLGYLKKNLDGTVNFKCVEADVFHQVLKYYLGDIITENDLVFYYNGKLAKFLKPIGCPKIFAVSG
jgi:hypothetical protein